MAKKAIVRAPEKNAKMSQVRALGHSEIERWLLFEVNTSGRDPFRKAVLDVIGINLNAIFIDVKNESFCDPSVDVSEGLSDE